MSQRGGRRGLGRRVEETRGAFEKKEEGKAPPFDSRPRLQRMKSLREKRETLEKEVEGELREKRSELEKLRAEIEGKSLKQRSGCGREKNREILIRRTGVSRHTVRK